MKNIINNYYGYSINNIHQYKNKIYFENNKKKYVFYNIDSEVNVKNIYELYLQLNVKNLYKIITNNQNNFITIVDNKKYVLLELNNKKNIDLNDVIAFNNSLFNTNIPIIDWYQLWINKIDYMEDIFKEKLHSIELVDESFNYYIGLAENATLIIKNLDNINICLSHKRIRNIFDFFNPFNLTIDYRIRDISEYFKYKFFNNENINEELNIFLNNNNLNINEQKCFIARMLFPTYYFDELENLINNDNIEPIKKIISKLYEYENILHIIYLKFKNNLYIEWLENINQY